MTSLALCSDKFTMAFCLALAAAFALPTVNATAQNFSHSWLMDTGHTTCLRDTRAGLQMTSECDTKKGFSDYWSYDVTKDEEGTLTWENTPGACIQLVTTDANCSKDTGTNLVTSQCIGEWYSQWKIEGKGGSDVQIKLSKGPRLHDCNLCMCRKACSYPTTEICAVVDVCDGPSDCNWIIQHGP